MVANRTFLFWQRDAFPEAFCANSFPEKSLLYRSSNSLAAALEKVTVRILSGLHVFCAMAAALFRITVVFPLPAQLITITGPSVARIASFWASSNKSFFLISSAKFLYTPFQNRSVRFLTHVRYRITNPYPTQPDIPKTLNFLKILLFRFLAV